MNLNIQYGKMNMALLAQVAIPMMPLRIGPPMAEWDAEHMVIDLFSGLESDIRIKYDTLIVTYYITSNSLLMKSHYEKLLDKLISEGTRLSIPSLYWS